MPNIILKVVHSDRATDDRVREGGGPLFRGNGDIDYLCGNCGFVIVNGFGPHQHVIVDNTTCPACGATNEFPPKLRA